MSAQRKGLLPGSVGLLEPLAQYLNAPGVTEVLINKPREIWVEDASASMPGAPQNHVCAFRLISNRGEFQLHWHRIS